MRKILLIIATFFLFLLLLPSPIFASTTWNEVPLSTSKQWNALSTSSDGQIVLSGVFDGRLYLSTNGGTSWTETQPAGNVDGGWQGVTMSPDGQNMLVGNYGGRLYISTNSGTSWSETQPAGNTAKDWVTASISDDGQKMLASASLGRIYLSSNGGTSWSETQPAGNTDYAWYATAVSGDGQTLYAAGKGGRIYLSTNGGTSWSETQPAGNMNKDWRAITISYDGLTAFVATDTDSKVYKTTNQGSSWTDVSPGGDPSLTSISMSSNTQTVFITGANRKLFLSSDSGASWNQESLTSTADFGWNTGVMSQDGSHFFIGEWIGRVYRGLLVTTSQSTASSAKAPTCSDTSPEGTVDLFQINRTGGTSQLFFTPVNKTDHYHVVYGYTEDDARFGVLSQQTGGNTGVQSLSIHGLDPKISYWFKVIPVNGCATGGWSNWLEAGKASGTKIFYKYH